MKKLLLSFLLGLSALVTLPVHALTATGNFNVNVNLYPVCKFVTAPTGTLVLRYVSLQTTPSTNTMDFSLQCTKGETYNLSFSPAGGTIVGLPYTLATTLSGTAKTSSTGTGATEAWKIEGTIASDLAGDCTGVSVDNTGTTGAQSGSATGTTGGVGSACTAAAANAHVLTISY